MPEGVNSPVFVSAVYGRDYLPFITAHLYSVWRAHPGTPHVVLWQDLPSHEIDLLRNAFPDAVFTPIEDEIEGNSDQKIPRRLHAWRQACEAYPGRPICFLDCDLLLLKPIDRFMPVDEDVIFTWKDEIFPLNAGVILIRANEAGRTFLDEWTDKTEALVTDPARVKRVRPASGGGSQHTFREIAGWVNYDRTFTRTIRGREIVFKGVPCEQLNETRCVPITDLTHIVHFKSGWHSLLLGKTGYTRTRPEQKCAEMYALWLRVEREACRHVAAALVTSRRELLSESSGGEPLTGLARLVDAEKITRLHRGSAGSETGAAHDKLDLPESWLNEVDRAMQAGGSGRRPADPPLPGRDRKTGEAQREAYYLDASLGSFLPSVAAWLVTGDALPRALVVECDGPPEAALSEIEQRYLRLAELPGTGNRPGRWLILPQEKEARVLAGDYPALRSDGNAPGWMGKVTKMLQRGGTSRS